MENIMKEFNQQSYKNNNRLTDWKNEPTYSDLKSDYDDADNELKETFDKIRKWKLYREGGPKVKQSKPGRSVVLPKLIRKQNEWNYPSLEEPFLSTPDMFKIKPRTWEDVQAAKQNEILLNYQFDVLIDKPKLVSDIVHTIVDDGTVIVKIGWDVEYENKEVTEETIVYATPKQSIQLLQQKINNGEITQEQAQQIIDSKKPIPIDKKIEKVKKDILVKNQPSFEICTTKNVYIDPTCEGDISKAMFFIHEYAVSMAELKRNEYKKIKVKKTITDSTGRKLDIEIDEEEGFYKNLDKLNNNTSGNDFTDYKGKEDEINFSFSDKNKNKMTAYEYWGYWDINDNGILEPIVATWIDDVLIRLEKNPYPFKKPPFVVAQYMPVTGSVYGEANAELLIDNQNVIGKLTRASLDIISSKAVGQKFIHSSLLRDPISKADYNAGRDVIYNANIDPQKAIMTQNVDAPSPVIFEMINMYQNDAESLTGTKAFNTGIGSQALGSVATGIRSAMDAASKRELSVLRRINKLFVDMARMTIAMNRIFMKKEDVIRLTNGEFIPIRRDDLQGNFDLRIEVSTAEANEERAKELAFMLQTMGNTASPTTVATILAKIAELRKMPDLAHDVLEDAKKQSQPDPMQEEMKKMQLEKAQLELENAKLQNFQLKKGLEESDSKIFERLSRTNENELDLAMKKAKALKEMAQAKKIDSETNKINTDTEEKITGADVEKKLQLKDVDKNMVELQQENEKLRQVIADIRAHQSGTLNKNKDNTNG